MELRAGKKVSAISARISIVVPAFNAQEYIERCIRSVFTQTHQELELIVVNDCSTDGTAAIVDELARRDARLKIIHLQENVGVHRARTVGIASAQGEFVGFVDSDDWIAPEMYEVMLRNAVAEDADIVVCGAVIAFDMTRFGRPKVRFRRRKVISDDLLARFCRLEFGSGVLWNKLYRARTIRPHALLPLERQVDAAEDYIVNIGCFATAARVVVLPSSHYYYYNRADSASRVESRARNFCRTLRAYVACLEAYLPGSPRLGPPISGLYVRQLRLGCYSVASLAELEPFREHVQESLQRLAAIYPPGIYSLIHAYDDRAAGNRGIRAALRNLLAAGKALARAFR